MTVHIAVVEDEAVPRDTLLQYLKRFESENDVRKILIVMGRYLPGYKDGGPVRSIKNLVDRLGTEYEFYILTVDRDHGDTEPYLAA